jgi:hypothetical protein
MTLRSTFPYWGAILSPRVAILGLPEGGVEILGTQTRSWPHWDRLHDTREGTGIFEY